MQKIGHQRQSGGTVLRRFPVVIGVVGTVVLLVLSLWTAGIGQSGGSGESTIVVSSSHWVRDRHADVNGSMSGAYVANLTKKNAITNVTANWAMPAPVNPPKKAYKAAQQPEIGCPVSQGPGSDVPYNNGNDVPSNNTSVGFVVELGGWSAIPGSNDLFSLNNSLPQVQIGTYITCLDGSVSYSAWYQAYPSAGVQIPMVIAPGDNLTGSITYSSATTELALSLTDVNATTTQAFSINLADSGNTRTSAAWLVELASPTNRTLGTNRTLMDFDSVGYNVMITIAGKTIGFSGIPYPHDWARINMLITHPWSGKPVGTNEFKAKAWAERGIPPSTVVWENYGP